MFLPMVSATRDHGLKPTSEHLRTVAEVCLRNGSGGRVFVGWVLRQQSAGSKARSKAGHGLVRKVADS